MEASVVEIKQLLQDVHGLVTGHGRPRLTNVLSTGTSSDAAELEDICLPADAGISSAPAAINRAVTTQLAGARRRVLEHTNLDLVEIGLLDESSADQLIRLYAPPTHAQSCASRIHIDRETDFTAIEIGIFCYIISACQNQARSFGRYRPSFTPSAVSMACPTLRRTGLPSTSGGRCTSKCGRR